MNTVVMARVALSVDMNHDDTSFIDISLVTTKDIVIPPFGCKWVKGLVKSLPVHSCWALVIVEPITDQQVTWESGY